MGKRCNRHLIKAAISVTHFLLIVGAGCLMAVGGVVLLHTELLNGNLTALAQVLPSGNGFKGTIYTMYRGSIFSFFIFGGMACIIGCIGCAIAVSEKRVVVIVHLFSLSLLMVVQITGAILLMSMNVGRDLGDNLFRHLVLHYIGDNSTNTDNVAWNYAMVEFSCCGATSYEDFESTTLWNRAEYVNGNLTSAMIPVTCCKLPGPYPDHGMPSDANCTVYPSVDNSHLMTPCRGKIEEYLNYYQRLMVSSSSVLGLIEVIAIMLCFFLDVVAEVLVVLSRQCLAVVTEVFVVL